LKIGDVVVSGSLRTRIESWDWFEGNANNKYTFPGSDFPSESFEIHETIRLANRVRAAFPARLAQRRDRIGPRASLDLGRVISQRTTAVRFKSLGGLQGQSLKVDRMEFIDGAEVAPANATLAAVKRERIA
jgi:hypothetical protein